MAIRDKDVTDWTLQQLAVFVRENQVPSSATIEYDGCGSHRVSIIWEELDGET